MKRCNEKNMTTTFQYNNPINANSKSIIYITAPSNRGKTTIIQGIRTIITSNPYNLQESLFATNSKDFCGIYNYKNKKIGLSSIGDPNSLHFNWLQHLINSNCDVMVCACRTRGSTQASILNVSQYQAYGFIPNDNKIQNNADNIALVFNMMCYLL